MASATGQKKLPQKENAIFKKVVVSTDKAAKSVRMGVTSVLDCICLPL